MTTRQQIADEARTWVGTPYQHQQSLKGIAVDCIGLIRGVARNVGLDDPFSSGNAREYEGYSRMPNAMLLIQACDEFMNRIKQSEATLGDVLLFNFIDRGIGDPQHFGLVSQTYPVQYMIHSLAPFRVVEHVIDGNWRKRIIGAYKLRGVTDG